MKHMENQNVLSEGTILHERFVVKKVIGVGGFGIAYLGEDTLLESQVAIKEYMPEGYLRTALMENSTDSGSSDAMFEKGLEDFLYEAKLLSRCQELDGIVSVRDFFLENGTAYLVMDYISGTSVKERVWSQGAMNPDEVLEEMKPVIFSLAKLHKLGYLHRDISSDNLLYTSQNRLKLIDFGSARKMNPSGDTTRTIMFKRGYAAEEQYRAKGRQGAWTDIYGICAVLYFMMTGVTPSEAVERVIRDEVVPLEKQSQLALDPSKKKAIDKGMSVFGKDRYQTVEDLYEALYMERIEVDSDTENLSSSDQKERNDSGEGSHSDDKTFSQAQKATFLATRTEFMKKVSGHYKQKEIEKIRKRKKRMLIAGVLVACLIGLSALFIWNGALRNGLPGQKNTSSEGDDRRDTKPEMASATDASSATGEEPSTGPEITPAENPAETQLPQMTAQASPVALSEDVAVPNVLHLKKAEAIKILREQSLKYDITYRYSNVTKGKVVSQSIEAGNVVKKGEQIALVVSRGKRPPETSSGNTSTEKTGSENGNKDDEKSSKPTKKPKVAGDITDLFG